MLQGAATLVEDGAAVSREEDRSRTTIRDGRDWRGHDDQFQSYDFDAPRHAKRPASRWTPACVQDVGGAEAPPGGD